MGMNSTTETVVTVIGGILTLLFWPCFGIWLAIQLGGTAGFCLAGPIALMEILAGWVFIGSLCSNSDHDGGGFTQTDW